LIVLMTIVVLTAGPLFRSTKQDNPLKRFGVRIGK